MLAVRVQFDLNFANFVSDLQIFRLKSSTAEKSAHAKGVFPYLARQRLESQQDGLYERLQQDGGGGGGGQYQKFPDGNLPLKLFTPFNFCIRFQNYCSSDVQQSLDGYMASRVKILYCFVLFNKNICHAEFLSLCLFLATERGNSHKQAHVSKL